MPICEDCGDERRRRIRCYHCGLLVCPWCWRHSHRCEPGHSPKNCNHLKVVNRQKTPELRKQLLRRMRARTLRAQQTGSTPEQTP